MKDGGPTSHSLKELLSAKAVEMEATTNTSITALITLYVCVVVCTCMGMQHVSMHACNM